MVSPGTTAGWRRADGELQRALEGLGVRVAICRPDFRIARHFRRTIPLTDLAEAAALRRALTKALPLARPRAILYSSPQATMLQPRRRLLGAALRFDTLARDNRPGPANALGHLLERRALARLAILLPTGLEVGGRIPPELARATPVVPVPIPVERGPDPTAEREPFALAYGGNPQKKGLDLIAQVWGEARPQGLRLVVTGIEAVAGRAFLRGRGVAEPPALEWAGIVDQSRYRDLSARAELFVSASRYEDYGLAQLEALADGALLVTLPSPGGYEALRIARELDGGLVAEDMSVDALARSLRAAAGLPAERRAAHRERARALLEPYSRTEVRRRLEQEVLPVLLPPRDPGS